jgi:Tfp pilus assembly PilM family ATPase
MNKPSLGIEIGERYLKLVAARPVIAKNAVSLEFAVEPITGLANDLISGKISSFLQRSKFKPKSTTICIPRNMLTVKTLQLPTRDPKESEQMIELHLGRLVPYKKEEILFGHRFLGVNPTGYSTEMLGIVRRDTIRRQCAIVEAAGLSADNIVLSSYGSWQWLLGNFKNDINDKDLYMLLDVDTTFIDMIIFSSSQLLFSRTINIESGQGVLGAPDSGKIINDIKQSLIVFYNEAIHKKPSNIFISGSTSVAGFKEKINTELGMTVKDVPSPVSKYETRAAQGLIPQDISLNAVSELVLEDNPNRISFVLPEAQIRKSLKEKTKELVVLGALLVFLFMSVMAFFVTRLHARQSYLARLNRQSGTIEESVGVMITQATKIEFIKEFLYLKKEPLAIMQELQKVTPNKIAITYIALDSSYNMTLRGEGEQLSDVFDFTTLLEKSPYFINVVTKRTRTKRVKEREITDFEITLDSSIK